MHSTSARDTNSCVYVGAAFVVFRSASASPTSSLVSSARVVRPSSRVAVTRDHASLPLSRKTADTTEHTLLHPQAPRTQQEFSHSLKCCAHTQRAHARQHNTKLPRVRGAAVSTFRCSCEVVALSLPFFGCFRPTPRAPPTLRATSSATSSSFFSASSTTPSNSSRMSRRS